MVGAQIREMKLTNVDRLHSFSWVKWLDIGDEPKNNFFSLLKAKQLRESMNILIIDNGEHITEEASILQEVERLYRALFTSIGNNEVAIRAIQELLRYTTTRFTTKQK